jgi:alanine-glyoxylate transaminase/serine-glyoxylate transaminase/serine-pyruvate transaminase
MIHPRVLRAISTPALGYMDPEFFQVMDETRAMLRATFQTENELTFPISGTGSAGMETAMANFIEPGDKILMCINGYFGERLTDMALRYGADVTRLEKPWGTVFTLDEIEAALLEGEQYKLVAIVHGETSTGALQPVDGLAEMVHRHGALLVLDCVTSLSGVPVKIDAWGVDIAYSATQKCLGCPSGLAPVTISPRAVEVLEQRQSTVANWYLDLKALRKHWIDKNAYHHTISCSLIYALREGLRLTVEEGLENRFARHQAQAEYMWHGLEAMDLTMHVAPEHRLAPLTTVRLPDGLDEAKVRTRLRDEYNIEIAGGFGPLAGKIWRIGLMGFSARRENVTLLLGALREILS